MKLTDILEHKLRLFFGFYVNIFEHENVNRYVPQLYYGLFCEENRKEFIENKMFA